MPVSRRRYDDLYARYQRLVAANHRLKDQCDAEREAKLIVVRQYIETDLLDQARATQDDGLVDQLAARLERALRACARYRAELAVLPPDRRRSLSLAMRLELAERARRSLDVQLRQVQAVNDVMCRERVTAAGNLAVPEPEPVPEPGTGAA